MMFYGGPTQWLTKGRGASSHRDVAMNGEHMDHAAPSLDRLAFSATVHCLTGCAIGEVLGLLIARSSAGTIFRPSCSRSSWRSSSVMR